MSKKILLIINPRSGKKKKIDVFLKAEDVLSEYNEVTTVYTAHRGHATELAMNCKDFDRIICMGGDGTLSEVCNGIMLLPKSSRPQLGYIPTGSTNDFAKGIGLPRGVAQCAKLAAEGKPLPIDIGSFKSDESGEKHFTYVASFGAFTKISYSTNQDSKNKLGHLAYIFEGVKSIGNLENFKPFKLRIETNNMVLEHEYIFGAITNSTSLAGVVKLDKRNVHVDDGKFELLLVRKPKNLLALTGTLTDIISKKYNYDRIIFKHTDKLTLTSEVPLDFTLDGEYAGAVTHAEINVIHNALNFVRPEAANPKIPSKKK